MTAERRKSSDISRAGLTWMITRLRIDLLVAKVRLEELIEGTTLQKEMEQFNKTLDDTRFDLDELGQVDVSIEVVGCRTCPFNYEGRQALAPDIRWRGCDLGERSLPDDCHRCGPPDVRQVPPDWCPLREGPVTLKLEE